MIMETNKWSKRYSFISLAAVFMLAVFVCLFLYQYDNKYTSPGPKGAKGVLVLSEQDVERYPVLFLVEGWAYYGGRLLTPADFSGSAPVPDEYIFIGQYGGFDAGDLSASPHGSATYRLTIRIPDEPASYLLELPEIFSAYRAYVNGRLAQTMGDPDPVSYRPETGNRTVNIEAGGQIDIVIAVSDFSHLYSGLTYPPAFGVPDTVGRLLSARLIFRGIFTAFALAVGALALLVGIVSGRNALAILYGLLCLFFVGYTSYPVLQTLLNGLYPFYAIENVSFCAMLAVVTLLQKRVYGHKAAWSPLLLGLGIFMCLASAALPFALTRGSLSVMGAYSFSVMAYEWITAAYLTVAAARAVMRDSVNSKTLMSGILIFDAALIMDRLLPFYEPVVTGWFPELASFALVLCIGIAVAKEVAAKYKDSAVLEERMNSMERLAEMQRVNYDLLRERVEETKTAQHDLRHHFVMIEGFLQYREYDKLEAYVREYQASIRHIQPAEYSKNPVVDVLARHYALLAERDGISLTMKLDIGKEVGARDCDLCALLSNLLENGLEACTRQEKGKRYIDLSIGQKPSMLSIIMENSTDGKVAQRGGAFLSSKAEGRKGYGLDSIRAIAARYNGDTEFFYDKDMEAFISTVLLTF